MKTKLLTICLLLFTTQVFAAATVIKNLPDIWDGLGRLFAWIFIGGKKFNEIDEKTPVAEEIYTAAEKFYNGMTFNDISYPASFWTCIILLSFAVNYIPTSLSNHKKKSSVYTDSFYSEFFLKNLPGCLVHYNYFKVISFFIIGTIWLSLVMQCSPYNPEPPLSNMEFWFFWVMGIILLFMFNHIIKCNGYSREIYTILLILWMISGPIISDYWFANIFNISLILLFYLMYFSPVKNLYEKGIKIKFHKKI